MDVDNTDSLDALSDLLTQISSNPYDISLHAKHIKLATAAGMDDQVQAARELLVNFWPAGDDVWLPMIEAKDSDGLSSPEKLQQVLAMFDLAESDYLSISLLRNHLNFLIERHAQLASLETRPEGLGDLFSTHWTRAAIASVVRKGVGHLTQSQLLWDVQRDWELEQLETAQNVDRENQIALLDDLHLTRLQQPHSTHEQTLQSYSTFTTAYHPAASYENLLVSAAKTKAQAVKSWERRERLETSLVANKHSLEAYAYYIQYERRSRSPDIFVMGALFERAISDAAKQRFSGNPVAEPALRTFWAGYCDALRIHGADDGEQLQVLNRAVRSVPGCGEVWARYIRLLERTTRADTTEAVQVVDSVPVVYDRALSTGLLQSDVEQIVPLVLARAGYEKRLITGDNPDGNFETLVNVLESGISLVHQASKQGDPRYRLEKYLADIYSDLADSPDSAVAVWQMAVKNYKSSYLAWTAYTDLLAKLHMYDEARQVFKDVHTKNLDWPEAIFDSWASFEHLYGSVEELEECLDKVERAQGLLNTRRAKEAEKFVLQSSQLPAEAHASIPVAVQVENGVSEAGSTAMDLDTKPDDSKKRKASPADSAESMKKARTDKPEPPKRDRENCTVFVADLPEDVTKDNLTALFKDCGSIKEIKVTKLPNHHVATVEFSERDSVPMAVTKDKKRINGHEIAVHLAWKSTLYVTNFPESADDASIRDLFGKFGVIFDVRWPSKKYKGTRRFCYIQYTTPESAEAALELHGRELEPGLTMNVYISDPERKKERTDASANNREVYVAGLSKFATKDDLIKLFKHYGAVKEVRMMLDSNGKPKGVAFVEFEEEASALKALQANNHDLKNRRIAVTLVDTRVKARHQNEPTASGQSRQAEIRSRSVRVKNLPPHAQEGLLQQRLEKIIPVKRVEIFEDIHEATIECANAADAGRLLLHAEPISFAGSVLQLSEERPDGAAKTHAAAPPPKAGGMFIPRTAVSRPRAGLGVRKTGHKLTIGQGRISSDNTVGKGQDDFRKMLG